MPEYLIEIKSNEHRRTRKEKIFCEAAHLAEKQACKGLEKGEYIYSVSNCQFIKGQIKPVDYR